jgi:hypothetical protein
MEGVPRKPDVGLPDELLRRQQSHDPDDPRLVARDAQRNAADLVLDRIELN